MKRKTWLVVGFCTLITLIFLCLGGGSIFWLLNNIRLGTDTDSPTSAEIEATGRFKLPPSAQDIRAHLEGFQDDALWVRFSMLPTDEAGLWSSSLCLSADIKENKPYHMQGISKPWWTPGNPKDYVFGEGQKPGFSQKILVDRTNSAEFQVFIEAFEN